ncbi:ATP-binding response regulator [Solibacillus sp. FSL K6-4121]|uniref:ATP-binding response regulator n=1 Tax=Solibacillus sp. FSL K6-4121 TaxID=2921505 RepID=UPI0030F8BE9E
MPKLIPTVKKSVRNQFVRMLVSMLFLFILFVGAFFVYTSLTNERLIEERDDINEKAQLVRKLDESFNGIFFRSRGYYAFKATNELNALYDEMNRFELHLEEFGKLPLSNEERLLYEDLSDFIIVYRNEILPKAMGYVEEDNYEALRELSSSGTNDLVNNFISYTKTYTAETDLIVRDLFNRTLEQVQLLTVLYILFGMIVVVIIGIILRKVIQNLISPIEKLTTATDAFASGVYVDITPLKKKEDELGLLATSFYNMTLSIQDKEEVLTTQNEELMAQQDELQGNQEQLKQSLNQLQQYSELNHVLTFTLDKGKLLEDLHAYLRSIYEFDSSLLYLVGSDEYVSKGLAKETTERLIKSLDIDKIARLEEEKTFVICREVNPSHQHIAGATYYAYDLYSCILNSEKKIVAILLATREGRKFTATDYSDINGHMNQASIAFERIFMYEEVERARKLNQSIIDTTNEGIQFVSIYGEVLLLNEALFKIIRYPHYEIQDKVPQEVWMKHFQRMVCEPEELISFLKNAIIEQFTNTRTMRYSINDDITAFIEVYATSVFEGDEKVGTMFVHRDITSEYEVDQMKSELVSTVSHELRTPLSSVLGFTELLLTKEMQPERQKRYIETIHKEAKRLTNLINDFLDLQRMESGRQVYVMEKVAFNEVVQEVLNKFDFNSQYKVQFEDLSESTFVKADEERLVQLLINLIGNAVKFSPNGGDIIIRAEKSENCLKVSIQDNGIGIPENEIPTLFQKFKRIDNSSRRKIGGTGLGLALSKEIVSNHNGEIWIESQENVGTTVYFTLPLFEQANIVNREDLSGHRSSSNPTVMIVEDDFSQALLLSEELKSKGFSILYHEDIERAMDDAQQVPLVGVVMDLKFGENLLGMDLVEFLRTNEKTKDIPIIISSALDKSMVDVEKYNVEKYFTKPYPPDELSTLLLTLIEER